MKIAIMVIFFPPGCFGGTEIATYQMAEHLAQRGHEVHVITSLDDGLPEESYEKGFYIHRLPRVKLPLLGGFIFYADNAKILRKIKPDIIHAQSLESGIPALLSNRLLDIPYTVYGRGLDVYLPKWYVKLTAKTVLIKAGMVIALTEDMKGVMHAKCGKKVITIPNGIDSGDRLLRQHEGVVSTKRILFVGRLHPIKGIQYLLNAMIIVHRELPDVKLILVGDGEERKNLENLTDSLGLRECVEFVGKVPHERIAGYMDRSDILVLPSLSEGFPVTVLEAMACGLPIVATRVGGIPDIIEEGVNGFLVEAKNPDVIANRLLMIMREDVLRKKISENNREKAKQYTWDTVAGTLEKVYREIIDYG